MKRTVKNGPSTARQHAASTRRFAVTPLEATQ